jgi:F-type H+-transporting ATPase subunit b
LVLGVLISMMIRKGESMLHMFGRVSLLAALSMFVLASTASMSDGAEGATEEPVAADHGDPPGMPPLLSFDIGSAVCNIAIFLGVFAILAKFVWPVILDGLQARENKIHEDLEAAQNANAEAKTLLADYQAKLDDIASQVQSTLAEARKDGEATGQRIVDEAKAEAERQRDRALADIETAKKVALSELAGQTSDMAINVARQVVGRELKADDHAELIRQSLGRLPSNN